MYLNNKHNLQQLGVVIALAVVEGANEELVFWFFEAA